MADRPYKIGVTGGIGSGKSTVCRIFKSLGIPIYNADDRAKQLISESAEIQAKIKSAFGNQSFTLGGYNRAYMASVVFNSPEKLAQLNNIIHPAVADDFNAWVLRQGLVKYIIKEAALLFDGENSKGLAQIFVVTAPTEVRISRVLQRDPQRDYDQINQIISLQMDEHEQCKRASGVIDNSGKFLLIPQILKIHQSLML
jgi:dephospho-CoA kinase